MSFPTTGRPAAELLQSLRQRKQHDVPWAEGRVFAYVYDAGPEAMRLIGAALDLYKTENGLDPTAFPSLLQMENEVIGAAIDLMHGGPEARGSFTSGGTESILLSVKTARDWARANKPQITRPELLLPETAHPAFFKACKYFDVKAVTVPVDPASYRAVPERMAAAVSDATIMMGGSAPSYAHGVIDPIEHLGRIALQRGVLLHVDCCVGGMVLPFLQRMGVALPRFDLSTPGVTQMSVDFHKWGYAGKGASCILYRDGDLRRHQIFAWSGWVGYTVINPTVLSTKSGGPLAACWAALNHIGMDGYLKLVRTTQDAAERLRVGIRALPGLRIVGEPMMNLFSFSSETIDLFALAEDMKERGWFIQPQFGFSNSPANIHLSVGASNAPHVEAFLADLADCVRDARPASAAAPKLPSQALALLAQPMSAALLEQLKAAIGLAGEGLPARMDPINHLLNALPAPLRDALLIEYIHDLYRPA